MGLISVNRWGPVLPTSLKFDDRPLLQLVGLIEDDGVHIHHGSTGVIMGRNAEPVTAVGADLVDIVDSLFQECCSKEGSAPVRPSRRYEPSVLGMLFEGKICACQTLSTC